MSYHIQTQYEQSQNSHSYQLMICHNATHTSLAVTQTHNDNDTPHHLNTCLLNCLTVASNSPYELEYSDRQVLQVIVLGDLHWLPVRQRISYKTARA